MDLLKMKTKLKPIHKFNGGKGATLCHVCSVIISIGLTKDLYCEKHKPKNNETKVKLKALLSQK